MNLSEYETLLSNGRNTACSVGLARDSFVDSVVDGLVDPRIGRLRFVSRLLSIRPSQSAQKGQGDVGRYKGSFEVLTGTEKEADSLLF